MGKLCVGVGVWVCVWGGGGVCECVCVVGKVGLGECSAEVWCACFKHRLPALNASRHNGQLKFARTPE